MEDANEIMKNKRLISIGKICKNYRKRLKNNKRQFGRPGELQ